MNAYIRSQRFFTSGTIRYIVFIGDPENHPNNKFLDVFPTRRSAERYIAASGHTLITRQQPPEYDRMKPKRECSYER